jgi:prepilin-type N-terminal cleavage/methylation domain-containing protein/prepilin-type processing-associated H-X9-DG protein
MAIRRAHHHSSYFGQGFRISRHRNAIAVTGRTRSAPAGFTVIELLVCLAIIAALCVIVLPAVQQARESARQVQCKNNLHQIGVALNSYLATTRCFPPGWIVETPVRDDSQNGWGWLAMLLPEAEQGPLFNSINFQHHLQQPVNETARVTVIESFVCPSDHLPTRVPFYRKGTTGPSSTFATSLASDSLPATNPSTTSIMFDVAGASYVGVFGTEDPDDRPDVLGDGVFSLNSTRRFSDLLDGASQTLVVGERSARRLAATWTGMHPMEEEGPERVIGFADHTPNDPAADEAEFSSRHPGGAHFLFGDGSTHFLSDHMDRRIYRAFGTRGGQEIVDRLEF